MANNWNDGWWQTTKRQKQVALPTIHNVKKKAKKVAKRKKP